MGDRDLQLIAEFLARRDVDALDPDHPVDVLVLCGSAVLPSLDVTAAAFHDGVTPRILVSGGVGTPPSTCTPPSARIRRTPTCRWPAAARPPCSATSCGATSTSRRAP